MRILLVLLLLFSRSALGADPGEMLADPALEARAEALGRGLRCLVCQNQSIEDSNADLARDLRRLVRERVAAGDADAEIERRLQARYGDFVLLKPPLKPATWVLWFGPPAIVLLALAGVLLWFRRRRGVPASPPPLSEAERRRLDEIASRG